MPRLAANWDPAGSKLSPAEGYLLSRVDGRTPWALLCQIGGLSPGDADGCLERWLAEGILELEPQAPPAAGSAPATASPEPEPEIGGPPKIDEDAIESGIDLPEELQRQILRYEASLDRPYHDLLGITRDADAKAVKRAYFGLSKLYHPDRYFRKDIGTFRPRLENCFKKIVEAYELLSDPTTRAEIEKSMAHMPEPEPAPEPVAPTGEGKAPADARPRVRYKRRLTKRQTLERLRRQFKIPEEVLAERRFRARQFYQSALIAAKRENWLEAASSIRLAIAFDPANPEYKRGFAELQSRLSQVRADALLEQAEASRDASAQQEALRLYEEALAYRPADPETNSRAAVLALEVGENERAQEYAEAACEFEPEVASSQIVRARDLRRTGLRDRALDAVNEALRLDPGN